MTTQKPNNLYFRQHGHQLLKHAIAYKLQLLHHLADPLGDLLALIVHLPVNLLLHQHLNDDRHPSNNLYYHCPMALSWYHHQKRAK